MFVVARLCVRRKASAGAFNALRGVPAGDEGATPASQILGYYQAQVSAEMANKRAKAVASLGLPDVGCMPGALGLFLTTLEVLQARRGRPHRSSGPARTACSRPAPWRQPASPTP